MQFLETDGFYSCTAHFADASEDQPQWMSLGEGMLSIYDGNLEFKPYSDSDGFNIPLSLGFEYAGGTTISYRSFGAQEDYYCFVMSSYSHACGLLNAIYKDLDEYVEFPEPTVENIDVLTARLEGLSAEGKYVVIPPAILRDSFVLLTNLAELLQDNVDDESLKRKVMNFLFNALGCVPTDVFNFIAADDALFESLAFLCSHDADIPQHHRVSWLEYLTDHAPSTPFILSHELHALAVRAYRLNMMKDSLLTRFMDRLTLPLQAFTSDTFSVSLALAEIYAAVLVHSDFINDKNADELAVALKTHNSEFISRFFAALCNMLMKSSCDLRPFFDNCRRHGFFDRLVDYLLSFEKTASNPSTETLCAILSVVSFVDQTSKNIEQSLKESLSHALLHIAIVFDDVGLVSTALDAMRQIVELESFGSVVQAIAAAMPQVSKTCLSYILRFVLSFVNDNVSMAVRSSVCVFSSAHLFPFVVNGIDSCSENLSLMVTLNRMFSFHIQCFYMLFTNKDVEDLKKVYATLESVGEKKNNTVLLGSYTTMRDTFKNFLEVLEAQQNAKKVPVQIQSLEDDDWLMASSPSVDKATPVEDFDDPDFTDINSEEQDDDLDEEDKEELISPMQFKRQASSRAADAFLIGTPPPKAQRTFI
ncbi:hypothetical protein PCE1_000356 [Barthelona sp. PCE]